MLCDFAIAGAGPAGSTLALLLARAGFRVLIADRSDFEQPRIGETAPPDLRPMLAQIGLSHALDESTHVEAPSIVSVWGSDDAVEHPHILSPFGKGVHLDRRAFDRVLADAAEASGAELRLRTSVRFRRCRPSGYEIIAQDGVLAHAKHVVLAGGRLAGPTELCGGRCYLDDQIGIAARIRHSRQSVEQRTLIEAVPGGWFYLAALPRDFVIAVFMTRAKAVPADKGGRHRLWLDALARTSVVRSAIAAAPDADALSVHDARASCVRRIAGHDWCAIGDARFAPDPLSGQGILWAIEDATRVARLLIEGWPSHAVETVEAHHHAELDDYRMVRAKTYAMEGRFPRDAYWRSRHRV